MKRREILDFKDFIDESLSEINLDERDINVWCDLIELLCYTNVDKIYFKEDIERELEGIVDGGIQLASLREVSEQMGFDIDDTHIFANDGAIDWGSEDASKSDLLEQITSMWFNHLKLRQLSFGVFYPFIISDDLSEISCKKYSKLTKSNKLYLYFTLTSRRNGLNRKKQKRLEFDFEPIAFESFKSLIPVNGKAYLMGKGSYTAPLFMANKFEKFRLLSTRIKANIRVTENYFRPKDSGENGIDFIGWLTYDDDMSSNNVYAGQATCMLAWESKYNDSSKNEMGGILDVSKVGSYTNALFIPYHFKIGNNWAKPSYVDAKNFVLFDRYRILKNIKIKNINNKLLPEEILKAIS